MPTLGNRKTGKVSSEDSGPPKRRTLEIRTPQIRLGEEGLTKIGTAQVSIGEDEARDLVQPLRPLGLVLTAEGRNDLRGRFASNKHLLPEPQVTVKGGSGRRKQPVGCHPDFH